MNLTEREFRDQGEYLGIGFDSFEEQFLSTAIELKDIKENELRQDDLTNPRPETFSFVKIHDEKDFSKSFSISGSISGSMLLGHAGLLNGEAKAKYFHSNNINFDNLCILLNYQITYHAYRIKQPQLSIEAKNFFNQENPENFRNKYGDEFIIGFRTGAEYTALIEVSSQGTEKKEEMYFDIQAALYNIYQAKGKADLKQDAKEKINQRKTNVLVYRKGSKISEKPAIFTLEEMIEDFRSFHENVKQTGGVKYTAIFAEYDQLKEFGSKSIITPELRELKYHINSLRLQKLKYQGELLDLSNELNFGKISSSSKEKEIRNKIYQIDSYIRECYQYSDIIEPERMKYYLDLLPKDNI
ncbi:MAG: hypothetical protein HC874_15855 [Richelia sp. SL_2_1]|nr:hypothetical protein [Richelia sp. SM1_7_0]NJO28846.1 hypothetical protein [Richelia sp. SL_2_1]